METKATFPTTTDKRQRQAIFAIVLACLLAALAGSAQAQQPAATWVVTSAGDSGPGTLRQAIAASAPGDLIVFDASLAGAIIELTSGQLVIDKDLVINGSDAPGVTVSGSNVSRVFLVEADVVVELRSLVIADGKAPDGTIPAGAIEAQSGGAIYSEGELRLVDCTVRDSRAGDGADDTFSAPGGHGGGVYSTGSLTVENSAIRHNAAGDGRRWGCILSVCHPLPDEAAASGGSGGGIYASGPLTVTASTVISNTAGAYGADRPQSAGGDGGGIYSLAPTTIYSSTVSGNAAGGVVECANWVFLGTGFCGAGRGGGLASFGQLAISDSVVSGNTAGAGAPGGDGGGIYGEGLVEVVSTVFTGNTAGAGLLMKSTTPPYYWRGDGAQGGQGGGIAVRNGALNLSSSLIVENFAGDGANGGDPPPTTLMQAFSSGQPGSAPADGASSSPDRFGGIGGRGGYGGGISAASATIAIDRSTISSNRSGDGGKGGWGWAICGDGGRGGSGGGMFAGNGSTMRIQETTVTANHSGDGGGSCEPLVEPPKPGRGGNGGGIYNGLSAVELRNATISGNQTGLGPENADDGHGGGIYTNQGLTVARDSTIADNVAAGNGSGGGIENAGITHIQDTLVADNQAGVTGPDCAGSVNLLGRNLIQHPVDCMLTGNVNGAILNRPALIGLLTLNAPGTTETHALLPGSPAINAANCSDGLVTTDQRGVPRPQGPACDIGAYEYDRASVDWRPVYLPLVVGE